ncbi:nuclear receptor coactivator 7-like isoform X2 [Corticium candelabrum]|nr:nuclear receptor coactivator 7-like isoform X2 [Corticium candelabrum]
MRRYVEDTDFLQSFLKRENRFLEDCNEIKEPRGRLGSFRQPANTVVYTVRRGETLAGIALCNDVKVGELKSLNRLVNNMLYTGQVLYVPASANSWEYVDHVDVDDSAPRTSSSGLSQASVESKQSEMEASEIVDAVMVNREDCFAASDEDTSKSEVAGNQMDFSDVLAQEEVCERYIKIFSKYITDGKGTVSGMLFVTSQCLMFNPSVLDPLVIDRGIDSYSLILPMDSISSCAVYDDFLKMQQKDRPAEVKAPAGLQTIDHPFLLCSRTIDLPDLNSSADNVEEQRHCRAVGSLGTTKLSGDINLEPETHELDTIDESTMEDDSTHLPTDDTKVDFVCETSEPVEAESTKDDRQIEVFNWNPDDFDGESTRHEECDSNSEKEEEADGTEIDGQASTKHEKKEDCEEGSQWNAAGFEFPRLSDAFEVPRVSISPSKRDSKSEPITIPRPARRVGNVNWFFCVQLSSPLDDDSVTKSAVSVPASTANDIGKELIKVDGAKPEYWFAIALERVDQLYAFLVQWCRGLQEMSYEQMKELEKDFVLISLNDLPEKQLLPFVEGYFGSNSSRKGRRESLGVEYNPIPMLIGATQMLTATRLKKLTESLPRRLIGYDWTLIYSTFSHGISLKTLYRNMLDITGPVVLVIQDEANQVFGALLSDPLRLGEHAYGTGECFLFTFYPSYRRFTWSGSDPYFIKCNLDSFVVGGGDGHYGLWIDDNLYHGSTHCCTTFNNEDLTSQQEFICRSLEAWGLY